MDKKLRNRTLLFLLLAGIVAFVFVKLSGRQPVAKIAAVRPARQNVVASINSNGKVEPIAAFSIRAQLDTFVQRVYATEGQNVKKGQVLVELDVKDAAAQLAAAKSKLLRAQELTEVWVPDAAHEAVRDVVRGRSSAVSALTRCRQHISSFLLRQGIHYVGKPWTNKHRAWLGTQRFEHAAHRLLFGELLLALDQAQARRERLTEHIRELMPGWSLAWLVAALQALRGYDLINAAIMVAELGDPRRFTSPRQLMGFVGLNVSEASSGDTVRRGHLTKTGNTRARKALIEAAWTYSRPAAMPKPLAARLPAAVQQIADKARHRLARRYRQLLMRGKLKQVAIAAVARESLGFIWAIAHAAAPAGCRPR